MFTGIIEGTGRVKSVQKQERGMQLAVEVGFDLGQTNLGESIALNGCCLTITSRLGNTFWADVSEESQSVTTLGQLREGDAVNLERPLKMGDRLGGHIVQGHVDGVGLVHAVRQSGDCQEVEIRCPGSLTRYLIEKGSIAVDGISLTINRVSGDIFSVMVIPHTKLKTTFQTLQQGSRVNLEVDIVGKYVGRLTHLDSEQYKQGSNITKEFLKKHGF